ncbi:MAG: methyltransferase domain-containing protein [Candidatus Hydrothermia bacterium]
MEDPFTCIAESYDEIMLKVNYPEWAQYIKTLFSLAPLKPIHLVLDLSAGTGSLSSILTSWGYELFCFDFSLGMLNIAKRKFEKQNLLGTFVRGDFRKIPFKETSFDAVISTFDSLNNVLDPNELLDIFVQVKKILKSGGPFIFDLNTEWSLKIEWNDFTRVEETANTITIWKSRYLNSISYLFFTLFVKIDEEKAIYKKISTVFKERGYDPAEVRAMLKKAGFEKIFMFDHFTFNPGKPKSSRVTYLAYH